MKKIFSILLTLTMVISSFFVTIYSAEAAENVTIDDAAIKQQYQDLINQGVLSSSVTYEMWAVPYVDGLNFSGEQEQEIMETPIYSPGSTNIIGSTYQEIIPAYTTMKAGDIFVTSDSFGNGLSGHAAIAISSTRILQMTGTGHSSEALTYSEWKSKYKKPGKRTWIYRHDDAVMAQKAADWARRNYWHPTGGGEQLIFPKYSLISGTASKNPSYCSLLVFQAYKNTTPSSIKDPLGPNIIDPYSLMNEYYRASSLWKIKPKLISTITNYKIY